MVMDYRAIERYSDLQMLDQRSTIEELPVFVSLDLVIPSNAGDRVASRKKRVTNHVAPTSLADALVLASMHPDPFPVPQRTEHHGLATVTLSHGKNIEFILKETFVHSVEMELGCHDLIIVEQEDELGFSRIDGCVASYADSDVVQYLVVSGYLRENRCSGRPSSTTMILGESNSLHNDSTRRWHAQGR